VTLVGSWRELQVAEARAHLADAGIADVLRHQPRAHAGCRDGDRDACRVAAYATIVSRVDWLGSSDVSEDLVEACKLGADGACDDATWILAAQLLIVPSPTTARRLVAKMCLDSDRRACSVMETGEVEARFLVARCERGEGRACAIAVERGMDAERGSRLRTIGGIGALVSIGGLAVGTGLTVAGLAGGDGAFPLVIAGAYGIGYSAVGLAVLGGVWLYGVHLQAQIRSGAEDHLAEDATSAATPSLLVLPAVVGSNTGGSAGPGVGLTVRF
jgi:hypothetical protein